MPPWSSPATRTSQSVLNRKDHQVTCTKKIATTMAACSKRQRSHMFAIATLLQDNIGFQEWKINSSHLSSQAQTFFEPNKISNHALVSLLRLSKWPKRREKIQRISTGAQMPFYTKLNSTKNARSRRQIFCFPTSIGERRAFCEEEPRNIYYNKSSYNSNIKKIISNNNSKHNTKDR